MKTLVRTRNTEINLDVNGNLLIFNHPLGITLSDLAKIKQEGYNFGFPFSKISLENVTTSEDLPKSEFIHRGVKYDRFNGIDQYREEFQISPNLSFAYFFDKNSFEQTSKALIFTFHNPFDCGNIIPGSFEEHKNAWIEQQRKAAVKEIEFENEMKEYAPGWYVVTMNVNVMVHYGNDGDRLYSFRVLADSRYDAYHKACDLALSPGGIRNKNVYNASSISDSLKSALIEYVGVWTDEADLEYGPVKG